MRWCWYTKDQQTNDCLEGFYWRWYIRRPIEPMYHDSRAWSKDLHFPQARHVWIYEGDVWQVNERNPIVIWLPEVKEGSWTGVTQFALEAGRVFRTKEAHEHLLEVCRWLGDEMLAQRVFGENHIVSVEAWEKTPASLMKDLQKACVE